MKIIHIGHASIGANGVGQVLIYLSEAQRKQGHQVLTLTVREKKDDNLPFKEVTSLDAFKQIVEEMQPNIVVFHSLYLWNYIVFARFLNKKQIPYLIQLHGALSRENYKKSHLKKWVANLLFYNRFIKKAQRIIYLNKGEYEKSIVPKINNNSVIIPNGVSIERRHRSSCDNKDVFRVVYIGRIESYHKGLDILIDAIKQLKSKDSFRKTHFDFYGTGESEQLQLFQSQIKSISSIASFHGPVYGEPKEDVMEEADIFVLTSRSEGMPMGILEALSHGVPCLITPQTNMADVITDYHCGWVADLDSGSIASTIEKAILDYREKSEEFRSNAIKASEQFSWDKIAYKSISVYNEVLHKELTK